MIKLNGIEIDSTIFPDGFSQVWKLSNIVENNHVEYIYQKERTAQDMIDILQLVSLIHIKQLHFNYLPYARQDKPTENNKTFGLTPFLSSLILCGSIEELHTYDAHNPLAVSEIIDSLKYICETPKYINHMPILDDIIKDKVVVFPDHGALSRYLNLVKNDKQIALGKTRNQLTGELEIDILTSSQISSINGKKLIIIDDLCDGGMTFIKAIDHLKHFSNDIELYTTHGLYTKGKQVLYDAGFKKLLNKTDITFN